jgi:hypothetical protein
VTVYDPHYYVPSVSPLSLNVNIPPSFGEISVTPKEGIAMTTPFVITMRGLVDINKPITYKY